VKMRTVKRGNEWYVVDVPPYEVDGETCDWYGPYATKADAESDRLGVESFYRLLEREERELKTLSESKEKPCPKPEKFHLSS